MSPVIYYAQLEQGARFLAARANTVAERQEHLGWANRYYRLSRDARETRVSETRQVAA